MIFRSNLNDVATTGRLGNQMWAIASAIGIARANGVGYAFPYWTYQRFFQHPLPVMENFSIAPNIQVYKEPDPYYRKVTLHTGVDWDLRGYFQAWKYFEKEKNLLWYYFLDNVHFSAPDFPYQDKIAMHVRRGDYLNLQHIHPVLSIDYYIEAMEKMKHFYGNDVKFIVFSDDYEWVKNNLRGKNILYHEPTGIEIYDMFNMYVCQAFIIANSSFSWWPAYLNYTPTNLVIAPAQWVTTETKNDRLLPEWIAL